MQKTTVIATNNLTRRFDETTAVNALNLEVFEGEVVGLLGHNGAGKTTTVRLLNGLLSPSQGSARVFDLDPIQDGSTLRIQTGVLNEIPSLEEKLTAFEILLIYGRLYGLSKTEIKNRSKSLLTEFNLLSRAGDRTGTYSKGMRQRLALARTLLHQPRLLFLDEPTNGLDPVATRQVHQVITKLRQDKARTVLMCTHNLHEAQHLCDKVAVMEMGQLVAYGPPETLARDLSQNIKVEIDVDIGESNKSLDFVTGITMVQKMQVEDATMTVWLSSREDIPDFVSLLVHNNVRILRVESRASTLEDVYFALHDKR